MRIRTLAGVSLETMHTAFARAFSDYQVRFDMPIDVFADMLATRDVDPDLSVGCFTDEELIGFILCGYRTIDTRACGYDAGTGIAPEYRQQGIGTRLLNAWLATLRNRRIDQIVLEVLEDNTPAIELYRKAGFRVSRTFACLRMNKAALAPVAHAYAVIDNIQRYAALPADKLMTFRPSWQNAKATVLHALARHAYVEIAMDGRLAGYGLIHTTSGNIPQIGVAVEFRQRGLERVILHELARRTIGETLVFLNIEQGDYLESALYESGFERFIGQYEMRYDL